MSRVRTWAAATLLIFTCGCAGPVREIWPPEQGAPAHTIIISLDTWHAMIAFPLSEQPTAGSEQRDSRTSLPSYSLPAIRYSRFEEWGYAEQSWYLEGRQGLTGVLRVLFWLSPGIVEVGRHDRVWADRTPQPPADRFIFHLSEQGYFRLRRYLQATIASPEPVLTAWGSTFYPATRSYNLLVHQCHQYVARLLREAGLPTSVFWAMSRGSFAFQLRRAARIAEEAERSAGSEAGSSAARLNGGSQRRVSGEEAETRLR